MGEGAGLVLTNKKFPSKAKLSSHCAPSLGLPCSSGSLFHQWSSLCVVRGSQCLLSNPSQLPKRESQLTHNPCFLSIQWPVFFFFFEKNLELNFFPFTPPCNTLGFLPSPHHCYAYLRFLGPDVLHFPLNPTPSWPRDLTHLDNQVNRINNIHASDNPVTPLQPSLNSASQSPEQKDHDFALLGHLGIQVHLLLTTERKSYVMSTEVKCVFLVPFQSQSPFTDSHSSFLMFT